jgi:hypothetical protein
MVLESSFHQQTFEKFSLINNWKEWFRSVFEGIKKKKRPEQESSAYLEQTVTLEQAKSVIPDNSIFFNFSATEQFAKSSTPHQELRDQVFIEMIQDVAAKKNVTISSEQAMDWLYGHSVQNLQEQLGVSAAGLEILVYEALVAKYPNIVWMRGGKFEDERELYGTVGEGILAISYVQKDAFGRQRKHPVLWVITLADILNAHKTGIFQARRGMAHIGSELVLDVKLVTDENAEKFRVWLQKQ